MVWLMTGRFAQLAFALPLLVALNTRGGLGQPWLNNFRGTPFFVASLLVGSIALVELVRLLRGRPRAPVAWLILLVLLPVTLGAAGVAARISAGVWWSYAGDEPPRLMSTIPSRAARAINDLSQPTDAVWVGPFDHESWLQVRARPASRHLFVHPWIVDCAPCVEQMLADFATTRPKMIVWYHGSKVWGHDIDATSAPVVRYLREHYFRVSQPNRAIIRHFYFPRDRRAEILAELRAKGYID
jgi:hypothetical protein